MKTLDNTQIIKGPVVSEKSMRINELNQQIVLKVDRRSTKTSIKKAVETLFDVKVEKVNTLIQKGKSKRWRGRPYQRSDLKKAVVTLADGDSIDVTTGI